MKLNIKNIIDNLKNPKSGWQTTLLVIFITFVYVYRAKQYLLTPQLYAEDGVLWLAEGYNKTFLAILEPANGFLHLPERLFGFVVAHLPLQFAPIIFVVTAWILFSLTAYYLLSNRTKIVTTNYERLFLVGAICLIANIEIFFFNFSNSAFLLGIIGVLIMLAKRPRNIFVDVVEKAIYLLSCLTLAFAWFYLPIALLERFKYKKKNHFFLYSAITGTIIQIIYYLMFHIERSHVTILSMFSPYTLLEIYNQMIIPAVRFARIDIPVLEFSTQPYLMYLVFLTMITLLISSYIVLRKSSKQIWYLLFFLVAMTFAVIKSPSIDVKSAEEALKNMAVVTGAGRYFIFGILAVTIIIIKTSYITLTPNFRYYFLAIFLSFGLITSLQYNVFRIEKNFTDYSSGYYEGVKSIESGSVDKQIIKVNPTPWQMTLYR